MVELKTYTKAELLVILEKKCPDALAKFPSAHAFEFKINKRNGVDKCALMIGHTVTYKSKKIMEVLWLEERYSDEDTRYLPLDHVTLSERESKKIPGFGIIYRPAYGAQRRDNDKLQALYNGMYYSTETKGMVNRKINNAKGFKGNDIFGTLSPHGYISCPFSRPIKALLRFTLLHCGHAAAFEEFRDAHGKVQGITSLVSALKKMAKNMPAAEDAEESEPEFGAESGAASEVQSEDQDGELFVRGEGGRKRGRDEVGQAITSKRMRREA